MTMDGWMNSLDFRLIASLVSNILALKKPLTKNADCSWSDDKEGVSPFGSPNDPISNISLALALKRCIDQKEGWTNSLGFQLTDYRE